MKVAIMQPYFLPYIGYWQLLNYVDTFVIYDNIQFTKKGWIHRNRILDQGKDYLFSLPLKKDSDFLDVKDRVIAPDAKKSIQKIINKIENSYQKAPFYKARIDLIKSCFLQDESNLFQFILNSVNWIMDELSISTKLKISSEIHIDHSLKSQDKVLALSKALNASEYINPIGGLDLYSKDDFIKAGVNLKFLKPLHIEYQQFNHPFISSLSIIDLLMFNDNSTIETYLDRFKLE